MAHTQSLSLLLRSGLSLSLLQVCNVTATLPPLSSTPIPYQYLGATTGSLADACLCSGSLYNLISGRSSSS